VDGGPACDVPYVDGPQRLSLTQSLVAVSGALTINGQAPATVDAGVLATVRFSNGAGFVSTTSLNVSGPTTYNLLVQPGTYEVESHVTEDVLLVIEVV
jgi:hypothetical protein